MFGSYPQVFKQGYEVADVGDVRNITHRHLFRSQKRGTNYFKSLIFAP